MRLSISKVAIIILLFSFNAFGSRLRITTAKIMPSGQTTVAYNQTLAASGGTAPYTWAVVGGALPTSLSLNTGTGAITGTPTVVGVFKFTIRVTDNVSATYNKQFQIQIFSGTPPATSAVTINTSSIPNGTVGSAYSASLSASGGTTPYTWSVPVGTPPAGVTLNSSTGVLSGTPTAPNSYSFTVRATDSSSPTLSYDRAFSTTIANPASPTYLFADDFESGNFSAWTSIPNGAGPYTNCGASGANCAQDRAVVESTTKHAGTYAGQFYYFLCSDSSNPACGASHQDTNTTLEKDFAAGFIPTHFFIRGYVRFHINAGGDGLVTVNSQRKLFYLNPTISNTWRLVLGTAPQAPYWALSHVNTLGTGSAQCDTRVNRTGVAIFPSGVGTFDSVAYALTNADVDRWFYIEVEVQLNTVGVADGYENVWVQGVGRDVAPVLIIQTHNVNIRDTLNTGLTVFEVGNQADRFNYVKIDELRYWDDIAVGTSYIGP